MKAIYIISYDENGRSGFGPFLSAEFRSLNVSYPKVQPDTVTYSVEKPNGERDIVTVSMVHTIQAKE